MSKTLPFIIGTVIVLMLVVLGSKSIPLQSAYNPGVGPDFVYNFKPVKTSNDAVFLNDPIFIGKNKLTSTPLSFNCKSVGLRIPPQGTQYYTNCKCTHISEGTKKCTDESYDVVENAVDSGCWTTNISYDALSAKTLKTGDVWVANPYITVSYAAEGHYDGDGGCYLTEFSGYNSMPGAKPPAGFQDDGTDWSNDFAFNIDVVNGIDSSITSGDPVLEIGNTTNITVNVDNRIADGIPGGVFVTVAQKGFFTGEMTFRVDQNLTLGNNSFQISIPKDKLGTTIVSIVGFVKVDVPQIQSDGTISHFVWYGTDDVQTNAQVEVVKHEQLSQFASKTLVPYQSPYKRTSVSTQTQGKSTNLLLPILLALLAVAFIIYIVKRNK